MWPPHLRQNLRRGLYAKRKGDLGTALSYLSRSAAFSVVIFLRNTYVRAWEDAKSTPLDDLGADPLLKLTGIAITFAGLLEDAGLQEQAYQTYEDGLLWMVFRSPKTLEPRQDLSTDLLKTRLSTPESRIRALSIAYKLGELANALQKPSAEEEKWLTLSVEALLAIMQETPGRHTIGIREALEELELPSWATLHDFAAPFEALGSFYSRTGKPE
jgi:hypothetical protein